MSKKRTTADDFAKHYESFAKDGESTTRGAESQFEETATLNDLVDPSQRGVERLAIARMDKIGEYWKLLFGLPLPIESRFDTTGSMGYMVDTVFEQLPREYDLFCKLLIDLGYDIQIANGNFNDRRENPILCRSMFEMSTKIAEQLQYMVPIRGGGDTPEDPDYGIFGAAFLTRSTLDLYSLKGYDFTVTDAPGRDEIETTLLRQVFGNEVFDIASRNDPDNILVKVKDSGKFSTSIAVQQLSKRSHHFAIILKSGSNEGLSQALSFWRNLYGDDRVIYLSDVQKLPEMKALVLGLTEGVFDLQSAELFLKENGTNQEMAEELVSACSHIPIGLQLELRYSYGKNFPKPGDFFSAKLEVDPLSSKVLAPVDPSTVDLSKLTDSSGTGFNW